MLSHIQKVIMLLWAVSALAWVGPVSAADVPRPNTILSVFERSAEVTRYWLFAPGSATPKKLLELPTPTSAQFSAGGGWYLIDWATSDKVGQVDYGRVGAESKPLPIDPGYSFVGAQFSTDEQYLAYTFITGADGTTGGSPPTWILRIIKLDSEQAVQFKSRSSYPEKPGPDTPLGFVPAIIGWNANDTQLFVAPIQDIEGPLGALIKIDLSGATPGADGFSTLPLLTKVLKDRIPFGSDPFLSNPLLSPDGSQVVYASSDPTRPVPNYRGRGDAVNLYTVFSTVTGRRIATSRTPHAQGTGSRPTWLQRSSGVLYTAAAFKIDPSNDQAVPVSPHLYILDVATGRTKSGPGINVIDFLACANDIFYLTSEGNRIVLYSTALADQSKRSGPLYTDDQNIEIRLLTCSV